MAAGMHALLLYPEQLEMLRDKPELMKSAVEEMLRWCSVVMHFRRTATQDYELAEYDDQIVGFLSSYIKPEDATCLFMWQIAVSKEVKGRKIGSNMLRWLVKQPACKHVNSLEATISPSSQASQKLLKRVAREYNANYELMATG